MEGNTAEPSKAAATTAMLNHDGTTMLDDRGRIVYRSQFLSTHPFRGDCKERSQGGKRLTYLTGDGVIRTMNAAFGHDGWTTNITRETQVGCEFYKGKWVVGYMATVNVTLLQSGASHEDCGCGEGTHESKLKALDTAIKSAVTDAMKRAARHFGERLGNALYVAGSGIHNAPLDNKMALRDLERREAKDLFGDQKSLYELRAKSQQASKHHDPQGANVADEMPATTGSPNTENTFPTILTRQTTPPFTSATQHANGNTNSSPPQLQKQPQLTHGFTRASELAASAGCIMVTPTAGQEQRAQDASSPHQQHGKTMTHAAPAAANKTGTETCSRPLPPPAVPGYNESSPAAAATRPLTQQSPTAYPNLNNSKASHVGATQVNPTAKRQKTLHNPYHH